MLFFTPRLLMYRSCPPFRALVRLVSVGTSSLACSSFCAMWLLPWSQGEYRAQLDADRSKLLARGRNHADLAKELKKDKKRKRKDGKSEKKSKKSKKDSKSKKKKSKKSKRRRTSSGGSSDSSSSSSSGSSSDSDRSNSEAEEDNDSNKPMRLSDWLKM
ncbi:hypothetical protein Vretimale_16832 [Volvox reticuliferus]|uniref:Uncharacterized protein n=1 Tax=Volvox reticuliferus TaxID=1737510 RepID=A0A8J4GUW2_9CHLO|nr:hypothetical protein Vretifemale_18517 [Volvox reticuliferus]GIM13766.1 hypothetical protein Vretimale_16832 [Volvox reticuliferus]